VSIGCVILPAFIVAWYYFSKRACRRVVVGFLKNEPCNESDNISYIDSDFARMEEMVDDQYRQRLNKEQRDDANNYSSADLTNRLVKWINRQNVFTDYVHQEYQLRRRTKENLFGSSSTAATMTTSPVTATEKSSIDRNITTKSLATHKNLMDKNIIEQNRLCDDDSLDDSSLFWECIPNPQQNQFSFCSAITTVSNDYDESTDFSNASTMSSNFENKLPEVSEPNKHGIV